MPTQPSYGLRCIYKSCKWWTLTGSASRSVGREKACFEGAVLGIVATLLAKSYSPFYCDPCCLQAMHQAVQQWWNMPEGNPWSYTPVLQTFQVRWRSNLRRSQAQLFCLGARLVAVAQDGHSMGKDVASNSAGHVSFNVC